MKRVRASMFDIEKDVILLKARDISRQLLFLDVRNIILRYNIRRVAITSDGNIIGIITEKDISKFLYEHAQDRKRLSEIAVKEFIQKRKALITVNNDSTI